MKTILITAYAVHPYKGSEDGTGWNIVTGLLKTNNVILITRKNNIPAIQQYILENKPEWAERIQLHGYDLPDWLLSVKKRCGTKAHVPYYYSWQYGVYRFIKRSGFTFDIAHCLNFHSDSHPHFLWKLGKPVVWGPIGHHAPVKTSYLRFYGFKSLLTDRLFQVSKWVFRNLDVNRKRAIKHTDHFLVINDDVRRINAFPKEKTTVLPAIAANVQYLLHPKSTKKTFHLLTAGRLHYMKGFDLVIRSFNVFLQLIPAEERNNLRLTIVGSGPEEKRLKQLAKSCGANKHIDWIPWVPFEEMQQLYEQADLFFFPSHEGAGMVVPEAMSFGVPVLTFRNAGPGALVNRPEFSVPLSSPEKAIRQFADRLLQFFQNPTLRNELSSHALEQVVFKLNWQNKTTVIEQIYESVQQNQAKTIAVIHPSSELYGADRILVLALQSFPAGVHKRIYLPAEGPLIPYLTERVANAEIIIDTQLPIIQRSLFTPKGTFFLIGKMIRFRSRINREFRKYNVSSVYVNTLACSMMLPCFNRKQLKTFIHVHEILDKPVIVAKVTALLSARFADKVICVSGAVQENLIRLNRSVTKNSSVIYNGIPSKNNSVKRVVKSPDTFVLFGRIMPKKGQWYLLEALSLLPKELLTGKRFLLVGDVLRGHEQLRIELQEKIDAYGLTEIVHCTGFISDIDELLLQADVCLVPSLMRDPFPTTVLEAMSAGKAIIATNHGGAAEAIHHGISGYLIHPNDPVEFAENIRQLIEKPTLCKELGINARAAFNARFSIQSFAKNWYSFHHNNQFI